MIAVSNEFKNAIKNDERRIKGYVEVLYDVQTPTTTVTSNMTSNYTDVSDIVSGGRVKQNYGTVDYLPLDGSYLTMDTSSNSDSGFISNNLSGANTGRTFTLSFASITLNGLTIYYKNNFPETTNLTFSDGTTATITATDEESYMQRIIFNEPKTLTSIQLTYDYWRYETRKVRIERIDLGLSRVYKDQDLVEFTIDEEVNKLVEEVPINETNVTINNINDLFNPLNPEGIVKYLTEGSLIIPYIGVLTESLGVEYVKMGEFYFDSYTNNSDKTTTLVGKNILKLVESEPLKDDNETNIFRTTISKTYFDNFMENYSYNYNYYPEWINCATILWKENNLFKLLKDLSFWQMNLFYGDRNNNLIFRKLDNTIQDTLTKSELIKNVEYTTINKLNTLNIIKNTYTGSSSSSTTKLLQETVTLTKSPQVFLIVANNPDMFNCTVTQSGGSSVTKISGGMYAVFVKVTGTVGDSVTLTFNGYAGSTISQKTFTKQEEGTVLQNVLEFDSGIYYVVGNGTVDLKFPIIENAPSYKISFDYNGDPSLEAGDYIEVETPYGYKSIFIQKNQFKFNGGLQGSIEGVE